MTASRSSTNFLSFSESASICVLMTPTSARTASSPEVSSKTSFLVCSSFNFLFVRVIFSCRSWTPSLFWAAFDNSSIFFEAVTISACILSTVAVIAVDDTWSSWSLPQANSRWDSVHFLRWSEMDFLWTFGKYFTALQLKGVLIVPALSSCKQRTRHDLLVHRVVFGYDWCFESLVTARTAEWR